jgi:hypothetical protein
LVVLPKIRNIVKRVGEIDLWTTVPEKKTTLQFSVLTVSRLDGRCAQIAGAFERP